MRWMVYLSVFGLTACGPKHYDLGNHTSHHTGEELHGQAQMIVLRDRKTSIEKDLTLEFPGDVHVEMAYGDCLYVTTPPGESWVAASEGEEESRVSLTLEPNEVYYFKAYETVGIRRRFVQVLHVPALLGPQMLESCRNTRQVEIL